MPGHVEQTPLPGTEEAREASLLSGVWGMLGGVLPPDEVEVAEFEQPFIEAFCSHCESHATHELVTVGEIRASEYRCSLCRGRTCRCANHPRCGGMAKVQMLWDEAMCVQCSSAVERSIEGIGIGRELEHRPSSPPTLQKSSSEPVDGWAVIAHLMLPPGLDGGIQLKKRPRPAPAHGVAEPPDSPTRRSQSVSPLRQRGLSPLRAECDATHEQAFSNAPKPLPRRTTPQWDTRIENNGASSPADAALSGQGFPAAVPAARTPRESRTAGPGTPEALADTAKALQAAMQVANPVTSLPDEVAAGASTTELETWEYVREALLSWPGRVTRAHACLGRSCND
jgi:hypothetical protein